MSSTKQIAMIMHNSLRDGIDPESKRRISPRMIMKTTVPPSWKPPQKIIDTIHAEEQWNELVREKFNYQ